ncbi:UNVERIFIED_CONTAM: putative mitochondrial protein [Sesamum latifolium]|uniref:Mitochondrial protein n=1 Tax=Sesamum latifolium TaxID=2727402 RepID=A0AAW2TPT1_9LAMI
MAQFRPISLCNVIYKLTSKAIANRLKVYLDSVISESQTAFIQGRLITDNVLISCEIHHFLKHKRKGKVGYAALKLDMSKAYDRIEWRFLERVLGRLGFHQSFISLIMLCISSVSFSFILNSREFGYIQPHRGLRQGDPLSPYLFICCTEALSCLIQDAESKNKFKGIAVASGAPGVSHLLFADDSLIFGEATKEVFWCIRAILRKYEKTSGQFINLQKSSVVFSRNTEARTQEELASILGVPIADKHEKYLGCQHASDTQKGRFSNTSGRGYGRGFWGGKKNSFPKQGKNSWRSIWTTKSLLRAGCRWHIGDGEQVRIWWDPWIPRPYLFRPINRPNGFLPSTTVSVLINQNDHSWNEDLIDLNFDLTDAEVIKSIPLARHGSEDIVVWYYTKNGIYSVRTAYYLQRKLNLQKHAADAAPSSSDHGNSWNFIWSCKVPNKIKTFLWRVCQNAIPTGPNLARKGFEIDDSCAFCHSHKEDLEHLFIRCTFARQARNKLVMEKIEACSLKVVNLARNLLTDFETTTSGTNTRLTNTTTRSWLAPVAGTLKINFDAAILKAAKGAGIGVVLRDNNGECIQWISKFLKNISDPTHAEALAAREASDLASQFADKVIQIERDCLNVIKDINSRSWHYSFIGPIIKEIVHNADNTHINFQFIRREANFVAHHLAKIAVEVDASTYNPSTINTILRLDALAAT